MRANMLRASPSGTVPSWRLALAALSVMSLVVAIEVVFADHGRAHVGWSWITLGVVIIAGSLIARTLLAAIVVPVAFTLGLVVSDLWLGAHHSRPIGWDLFDHDSLRHTVVWLSIMLVGVSQLAILSVLMGTSMRQLFSGDEVAGFDRLDRRFFIGLRRDTTDQLPPLDPELSRESPGNDPRDHDGGSLDDLMRRKSELVRQIRELEAQRDWLIVRRALSQIGLCATAAILFGAGMIAGILIYVWLQSR